MKELNYPIYEKDSLPYNLNLTAWRNPEHKKNEFNCYFSYAYKYRNHWIFKSYKCTTYPGDYYLRNPLNKKGTLIITEGFYKKGYRLGLHKGQYEALVQVRPITVYRDNNKDSEVDLKPQTKENGYFGANIHRAKISGRTEFVNKWSAGCIVFQDIREYLEFIEICKQAEHFYGDTFSLSVIRLED